MTPDDAQEARRLIQELLAANQSCSEIRYALAANAARAFLSRTAPREPWTAEKEREAERIFDESCGTRR